VTDTCNDLKRAFPTGIEGTVDIATICGTTGPIVSEDLSFKKILDPDEVASVVKIGKNVQTIRVKTTMP
jgi:hypothetical protein